MNQSEVQKLVAMLVAAFPNNRATRETVQVYERMLVDLDADKVTAAFDHMMATLKFMPSIAEIRGAVAEMERGPVRGGAEAWGDVLRAIRRYGYMRSPGVDFELEDTIAMQAIYALGWRELCNSENQTADRARFIECYDQLAKRARVDVVTAALPSVQRAKELRAGNATVRDAMAETLKRLDRGDA